MQTFNKYHTCKLIYTFTKKDVLQTILFTTVLTPFFAHSETFFLEARTVKIERRLQRRMAQTDPTAFFFSLLTVGSALVRNHILFLFTIKGATGVNVYIIILLCSVLQL